MSTQYSALDRCLDELRLRMLGQCSMSRQSVDAWVAGARTELAALRARVAALEKACEAGESFIHRAESDHECCDPENCRFCCALAKYRAAREASR